MIPRFIETQTTEMQPLWKHIRQFVLDLHPDITEKMRYSVPFFDYFGWMCYLNPIDKPKQSKGIDICFLRGMELQDEFQILEGRNRKQVKSVVVSSVEDFNECEVAFLSLFQEAMQLNLLHHDLKQRAWRK